jgi:hypothetical protein
MNYGCWPPYRQAIWQLGDYPCYTSYGLLLVPAAEPMVRTEAPPADAGLV